MDYTFLFYIFVSFVIATGGAYILASNGRIVTALIFLLGAIAIEAFFGMRWFKGTETVKTAGAWPPVINACPDFLSAHKVNGKMFCVDTLGVTPGGGIERWTNENQTDARFLFNLFTEKTGTDRAKALCDEARTKKVTWEGVFDGTTCLNNVPPLPPTA